MRCRPDFSWKKMRHRQGLSNKMRCRPVFLTKFWWILFLIDIVCNDSFYTNHSSDSSSFNSLIDLWPAYSTFVFPTHVDSVVVTELAIYCHLSPGARRAESSGQGASGRGHQDRVHEQIRPQPYGVTRRGGGGEGRGGLYQVQLPQYTSTQSCLNYDVVMVLHEKISQLTIWQDKQDYPRMVFVCICLFVQPHCSPSCEFWERSQMEKSHCGWPRLRTSRLSTFWYRQPTYASFIG